MENNPPGQEAPKTTTPKALWVLIGILVVVAVGIGLSVYFKDSENSNANVNATQNVNYNLNSTINGNANVNSSIGNLNSSTINGNINAGSVQTLLYQGNGFSVRYPVSWSLIQNEGVSPKLTPKNATFKFEGSIDYPISVGTTAKNADQYVASLPSSNKSQVTINGYSGYKAYPDCPTCGDSPFYIFTLPDQASAVIIGYTGDVLEQTDGSAIARSTLRQVFDQVVNSIQID